MKHRFLSLLWLWLACAQAQNTLPTAQELVAISEIGGAECTKVGQFTAEDQDALRKFVAGLFKQRTYEQYLASPKYEIAKNKATEDIAKNGLDRSLCSWLKRLPKTAPGGVMFFEPRD